MSITDKLKIKRVERKEPAVKETLFEKIKRHARMVQERSDPKVEGLEEQMFPEIEIKK